MRFKRADMPGMLIAVLGPVGLFLLVLESYQLWDHHGTPILGMLSVNIAVGGGIVGAFWRFLKARDLLLGLILAVALSTVGVLVLRASGNDGTAFATLLKIAGVILFLALNAVIVQQLLWNGLGPILERRDAAREAAAAEAEAQE